MRGGNPTGGEYRESDTTEERVTKTILNWTTKRPEATELDKRMMAARLDAVQREIVLSDLTFLPAVPGELREEAADAMRSRLRAIGVRVSREEIEAFQQPSEETRKRATETIRGISADEPADDHWSAETLREEKDRIVETVAAAMEACGACDEGETRKDIAAMAAGEAVGLEILTRSVQVAKLTAERRELPSAQTMGEWADQIDIHERPPGSEWDAPGVLEARDAAETALLDACEEQREDGVDRREQARFWREVLDNLPHTRGQ